MRARRLAAPALGRGAFGERPRKRVPLDSRVSRPLGPLERARGLTPRGPARYGHANHAAFRWLSVAALATFRFLRNRG